jgi:glycosyltransferase involved in cell wall biosynthesis
MPPARNGIADYAALLAGGLAAHYAVAGWDREADDGAAPARVLHQLGNSAAHGFVLRALRRWPGVVTLHDPGLLWLHQQIGEDWLPGLAAPAGTAQARLAAQRGRQLRAGEEPGRGDHLLFDVAGEVLALSRAVVVHSRFAAARLRALHGAAATAGVAVVPHLLPPVRVVSRAEARRALGWPPEGFVLGSAGMPHPAKRFDWVAAAVAEAQRQGAQLRYVHAGSDDPALPAGVATGWLPAEALDLHIAACDALLCLHFPSHGEASGVLARGLALGVCCLVVDTAGCAELPRDAVLHLPPAQGAAGLAAALVGLAGNPTLAWSIGAVGQRFGAAEMGLAAVASRYRDVIEGSLGRMPAPVAEAAEVVLPGGADAGMVEAALAGRRGVVRLVLAGSVAELGAAGLEAPLLARLLPPWVAVRGLRLVPEGLRLEVVVP